MPLPSSVYDSDKDETHYYIDGKQYTIKGDVKDAAKNIPNDTKRNKDGSIDWLGTGRDVGMSAIPALASALLPEATVAKPLAPLAAKAASSVLAGTGFDQLMDKLQGGDKGALDSLMSAIGYTGMGMAPEVIPGLGNLGVEAKQETVPNLPTGKWGNVAKVLTGFKPYLKTGPNGITPQLDPYSSALLGFSLNGAAGNLGPETQK